jgi:hypothetical protein
MSTLHLEKTMTDLSPTNWRALCAELHAAFNTYAVDEAHHNLLERARAALAQPEPPSWRVNEERTTDS